MKNIITLNYGYQECEDGIWHAFEATDPSKNVDDDEIAERLADLLDTTPDDDRFNWDCMDIQIPESVVERIKQKEPHEMSYADLLTELNRSISADACMPDSVTTKATGLLEELQRVLWPYSA